MLNETTITMKTLYAILLFLVSVQPASAVTLYDQLCQFNPNWSNYRQQAPAGEALVFRSDRDYIQAHLTGVIAILRNAPATDLSKEQYASRMHLIGLLDGYRIAGKFPVNYYRQERIPVFIDEHQTHCAVGFLMQQTGHEAMAQRIASANNYVWVKDLHDTGVPAWQEASGFSTEELKLIQGAYDFYLPDAFIQPNKYEIPQKPDCMVAYFEDGTGKTMEKKPENIWCRGQGQKGVLNGRWEQNYGPGVPWIVGYYENGKRSGQWEEYYQGTNKLCRTECWRNDKLNGIRRRFDRAGKLVEEILFKDGKAVTKTNYDLALSLTWIRQPLDSTLVYTEVYTSGGSLIAAGHEKVHNPGNLLWFQNIELTALNSAAITSRTATLELANGGNNGPVFSGRLGGRTGLYNSPPLVEYKKEGDWMYYREYNAEFAGEKVTASPYDMLTHHYQHFGTPLYEALHGFDCGQLRSPFDSIRVAYADNQVLNFYGFGDFYMHLQIQYYDQPLQSDNVIQPYLYVYSLNGFEPVEPVPAVRMMGLYNATHQKIGSWKLFDREGRHYKTETFIIPRDEEEELVGVK
jgi:hypothetical protein